MQKRKIKDGIFKLGSIDWDRRLFDSLILCRMGHHIMHTSFAEVKRLF
jgi:hypothetical protein